MLRSANRLLPRKAHKPSLFPQVSANLRSTLLPLTLCAAASLLPAATSAAAITAHVSPPNLRQLTTHSPRYHSQPIRHAPTPSAPPNKPVSMSPIYAIRETGKPGTLDYRVWVVDRSSGMEVSAWHDIPLLAADADHQTIRFNYVNEIGKGTRAKFEIATKEAGNPIKQDVKKGSLRSFTYGDIPFNYGCLPQTWEDPHELDPRTQLKGDNDPLDVVELSDESMPTGGVTSIQLIGALALIDEGETDWKMLAIRSDHPAAAHITNARQLQQHWPDKVRTIIDWFRNYKTTDGKPKNEFAFKAEIQDVPLAQRVVWDTHAAWARLKGKEPSMDERLRAIVHGRVDNGSQPASQRQSDGGLLSNEAQMLQATHATFDGPAADVRPNVRQSATDSANLTPIPPATSLPPDVKPYRRSSTFTNETVPKGLLRHHKTKAGVWGQIHVEKGTLLYHVTDPRRIPTTTKLTPETAFGTIEPQTLHRVEPVGEVQFFVEFHSVPAPATSS